MGFLNGLIRMSGLLADYHDSVQDGGFAGGNYAFLIPILDVLNNIIWPILIVLAAVGSIYAIYLGVMMAKAENAEKREEAKKRIINAVIAIVIVVVLILLMKLFITYAPNIIKTEITDYSGTEGGTTGGTNQNQGSGNGLIVGLLRMMK